MKARHRPTTRTPDRIRGVVAAKAGLIAMLLPMAAGLSAQTPLHWDGGQQPNAGSAGLNGVYSPKATMTRMYPGAGLRIAPLAEASTSPNSNASRRAWSTAARCPGSR